MLVEAMEVAEAVSIVDRMATRNPNAQILPSQEAALAVVKRVTRELSVPILQNREVALGVVRKDTRKQIVPREASLPRDLEVAFGVARKAIQRLTAQNLRNVVTVVRKVTKVGTVQKNSQPEL